MIQKVVNYKVDADAIEAALETIKEFVEAIRKNEPQTNYQAFQMKDDKSRFMHSMSFPDANAEKTHHDAEYTQKFAHDLYPLCKEQPKFSDIETVADTLGDGVVDWAND